MKLALGFMILLLGTTAQARTVCEISQPSTSKKIFSGELPSGSESMLLKADGTLIRKFNVGQLYGQPDTASLDKSTLISIVSEGNGRRTMYLSTLNVKGSEVSAPTEAMVMGSAFDPLWLISPPKDITVLCGNYGKN